MSNKLKKHTSIAAYPVDYVAKKVGTRTSLLKEYLDAREEEYREHFEKEYMEKLKKSQDFIAANNLLVSYLAIKKAYGFKKAFGKYLDVLNEAQEEMNRRGVEDVYGKLKRITDRDFMFDDDELNKEFGFGKE